MLIAQTMKSYSHLYVTAAFFAGVLLTLGFKDFYPDLERRFRRRKRAVVLQDGLENVALEDNTHRSLLEVPKPKIPEGIEACIGNTSLFKIKSLSDATGCEILAKAEVSHILTRRILRVVTVI